MRDDSVDFALRLLKALHDDCNLARKSSVVPCVGGDNDMIDVGEEFAPYLAIVANGFAVAVARWAALFGVHHKRHSEGAEGRGGVYLSTPKLRKRPLLVPHTRGAMETLVNY